MIHVPRPRSMEDELNEGESMLKTIKDLSGYEVITKLMHYYIISGFKHSIFSLIVHVQFGKFWVYGEIYEVKTLGGWNYMACRLCLKKLKKNDSSFYCEGCNTYDVVGRMRYKMNS